MSLAMLCLWGTLGFGGEKTFSLLVSGGLTRIDPRDLNNFLKDYADYYLDYIEGIPDRNMIVRDLRTTYELEFTLLVRAAPRVFLTLGSGFILASLESDPLRRSYPDFDKTIFRTDRIHSIPIRFGLLYSWPLSRRLSLRPHLSLDAYLSYFKDEGYEKREYPEEDYIGRYEWEVKAHAFSWGSTTGLSLNLALSETVSLSLDAGYRKARLASFHETDVHSANGEFRLFYYEFYSDWTKREYRLLNLPTTSGSASLDVVRDAVLDLSGPYLKAGLRVSF